MLYFEMFHWPEEQPAYKRTAIEQLTTNKPTLKVHKPTYWTELLVDHIKLFYSLEDMQPWENGRQNLPQSMALHHQKYGLGMGPLIIFR